MNRLLIGLLSLMLVGAGCLPVANKMVEGKWKLAFDLPEGWVMVVPYEAPGSGTAKPVSESVDRTDSEVYLQSAKEPMCWTAGGPCAEGSLVNDGKQIRVTVLDPRRKLDLTELKDLGKGFYVKLGTGTPADGPELFSRDRYYYVTEKATYQFDYIGSGPEIEALIKSAKEVTRFTDGPQVEVETK